MVCMDDQYKLTWKCVCVLQKVRPGICNDVSNMYVFTQRIFFTKSIIVERLGLFFSFNNYSYCITSSPSTAGAVALCANNPSS